jgi:hypothetical protein
MAKENNSSNVPKGFHRMPDGSLMKGTTHKQSNKKKPAKKPVSASPDKKTLYKPVKSTRAGKKYQVYVKSASGNPKLIHFGDSKYGQFKDKLGLYSSKDHGDPKRKKAYYSRHGPATSKDTPKYWSHKILW